ncbi:hypothetical protein pb186bvf_006839 [Paramecium bursaria]
MSDGEFEIYFSGLYSVYSFANIFLPLLTGNERQQRRQSCPNFYGVAHSDWLDNFFLWSISEKVFSDVFGKNHTWVGHRISSPDLKFICFTFLQKRLSSKQLNKFQGFTIGMNNLFATFGGILMMYNAPKISSKHGVVWACLSGTIFNIFSLICTIIAVGLDYHADITLQLKQRSQIYHQIKEVADQQDMIQYDDRDDEAQQLFYNSNRIENADFTSLYWKVAFFYGFIYTSVVAYINISVGLLTERWLSDSNNPEEEAGEMIALEWFITGVFTPIFGSIIDRHGGRSYYCIASALLCMIAHISIWYIYPFFSMICLGTGLAIALAGPWTSIIYIVKPYQIGKAYSYVLAIYNSLFSIFPVMVGILRAYYGTYFYSQIMLSFLAGVALLISFKFINKSKVLDGLKEE